MPEVSKQQPIQNAEVDSEAIQQSSEEMVQEQKQVADQLLHRIETKEDVAESVEKGNFSLKDIIRIEDRRGWSEHQTVSSAIKPVLEKASALGIYLKDDMSRTNGFHVMKDGIKLTEGYDGVSPMEPNYEERLAAQVQMAINKAEKAGDPKESEKFTKAQIEACKGIDFKMTPEAVNFMMMADMEFTDDFILSLKGRPAYQLGKQTQFVEFTVYKDYLVIKDADKPEEGGKEYAAFVSTFGEFESGMTPENVEKIIDGDIKRKNR